MWGVSYVFIILFSYEIESPSIRKIFEHIICVLARRWSHPSVLNTIKDITIAFKPKAFLPSFD